MNCGSFCNDISEFDVSKKNYTTISVDTTYFTHHKMGESKESICIEKVTETGSDSVHGPDLGLSILILLVESLQVGSLVLKDYLEFYTELYRD